MHLLIALVDSIIFFFFQIYAYSLSFFLDTLSAFLYEADLFYDCLITLQTWVTVQRLSVITGGHVCHLGWVTSVCARQVSQGTTAPTVSNANSSSQWLTLGIVKKRKKKGNVPLSWQHVSWWWKLLVAVQWCMHAMMAGRWALTPSCATDFSWSVSPSPRQALPASSSAENWRRCTTNTCNILSTGHVGTPATHGTDADN